MAESLDPNETATNDQAAALLTEDEPGPIAQPIQPQSVDANQSEKLTVED